MGQNRQIFYFFDTLLLSDFFKGEFGMKALILVFMVVFSSFGFGQQYPKSSEQLNQEDKHYNQDRADKAEDKKEAREKEARNACAAAKKEFDDARAKENPCEGYGDTPRTIGQCEDLYNKCTASSTNSFDVDSGFDINSTMNKLGDLFGAANAQNAGAQAASKLTYTPSECNGIGGEKAERVKKDREAEIKRITKDIEEQRHKINEENAKLSKEQAEIKEEQTKLNNEAKKTIQKLEVSKREKLTQINKDIQESGTQIRKLNNEIIKKKMALEKIKFEHINSMKQFAEDKINSKCRSVLDTAKSCMNRSRKGEKFPPNSDCSLFQFSGKGASGTNALKKKLKEVNDSCFDQVNEQKSRASYDYSDTVKTSENELKEMQSQIKDANDSLALKQKEVTEVSAELDKEKQQELDNLNEQIANFAEKTKNLIKNNAAAVATSEKIIARLNKDLDDLSTVILSQEMGITTSTDYIKTARREIGTYMETVKGARDRAANACNCSDDKMKNISPCPELVNAASSSSSGSKGRQRLKKVGEDKKVN